LVTLIAAGPPPSTIMAVANRPKIDTSVSDAIVGTDDTAAIRALLSNPTAQIREATLDALAAQSEAQTDWQAPLVNRPYLPPRAQRMLAEIVTGHLLETLAARNDLHPRVAQTVRAAVELAHPNPPPDPLPDEDSRFARAHALALNRTGKLDDEAILEALRRNENPQVMAMLAVKADVRPAVVERACALRSAKGIVSLTWKAGLTVQTAVVLQVALANLTPDLVLRPSRESLFPLSEDEMRWQLAFLDVPDRASRAWRPRPLGE
jgi:uncharacterized protein (DUF2336 family)